MDTKYMLEGMSWVQWNNNYPCIWKVDDQGLSHHLLSLATVVVGYPPWCDKEHDNTGVMLIVLLEYFEGIVNIYIPVDIALHGLVEPNPSTKHEGMVTIIYSTCNTITATTVAALIWLQYFNILVV